MDAKPVTMSIMLALDNGKEMAITFGVADEDAVREAARVGPLLISWMHEGNAVNWASDNEH